MCKYYVCPIFVYVYIDVYVLPHVYMYIHTYIYIYIIYNYLDPPRSPHRAWSQGFPLRIGVLRCDELHLGEEIRQMLDVVADDKPWCFNIAMEAMAHRNR